MPEQLFGTSYISLDLTTLPLEVPEMNNSVRYKQNLDMLISFKLQNQLRYLKRISLPLSFQKLQGFDIEMAHWNSILCTPDNNLILHHVVS